MALFPLWASRVIRIEPLIFGTITEQETHGKGLLMGYSSNTPSFSILLMASETLALRWYGTDMSGTTTGFIDCQYKVGPGNFAAFPNP